KDVILRAIGGSNLRAGALEKGIVAAAPFAPDDTVRLTRLGFPLLANLSDSLIIPQTILTSTSEFLDKNPETSRRFLKALILGIQLAKFNKPDAIRAGFEAKLQGAPALSGDLSVNAAGVQFMLDEDKRNGLIDPKFTLERAVNDKPLKAAQQELRAEGRLK